MKNLTTKLAVTAIAIVTFVSASLAQFEGTIMFKKMTLLDTTNYIYYVKGNKVRIDEIGTKSRKVEGSFIIDLAASTMISLSHDRKLYMDQKPGTPVTVNGKPEITSVKSAKTILGVNCKEVTVVNKDENATIKYYVGGSRFDFFAKMLKLMNRKDKQAAYFLLISKDAGDAFPYLSIQTDSAGKETGRLEVERVDKQPVDAPMFEIPKDYHKFEKN